jgi:Tfp pilus assembly protein PilV
MIIKKKDNKGQSLFELVLAFGVTALVLVSIVGLMTTSVRNVNSSRNRSLASRYSRKTIEWLRSERDKSWNNLDTRTPDFPHSDRYCIPSEPLTSSSWPAAGNCTAADLIPDTSFTRWVDLEYINNTDTNTIVAEVSVQWTDTQGTHTVNNVSYFSSWQGEF